MAVERKVILFIVEGASDKIALGLPLSKIISTETVQFAIMHGDCLNRGEGKALAAVQECIRSIMQKYNYKRRDFSEIVHIVDTDGAFIPDSSVFERAEPGTRYFDDRIETGEIEGTLKRHSRRKSSAIELFNTKTVLKIPYGIYFMSRNLEHVTYGIASEVSSKRKVAFAEEFADRYADDTYAFTELLFSDEVAAKGSFEASWKSIMTGTNSLKRKSNLNIFLNLYYNSLAEG